MKYNVPQKKKISKYDMSCVVIVCVLVLILITGFVV